ncbi:MAG: DUF1559 domain-containing protein [Planctomycetia bacterium]|nr:DUF1559 domain-containing protein [Planctomycetia bacterium]
MKRTCCYTFLIILALAGVCMWNFFVSVPLKISPETTIVTEPLTADGRYIDYFSILEANYPPEMKTEKNSAREIVRRLGPGSEILEYMRTVILPNHADVMTAETRNATEEELIQRFNHFYSALGLEPISPKDAPESLFTESPLSEQVMDAEGNENFDWIRAWVTENSPAIDVISEAVRNAEVFTYPYILPVDSASLSGIGPLCIIDQRHFMYAFQYRARVRVADGDVDGAIDDIIAGIRLGRQIQKGSQVLVRNLIGNAIERAGMSVDIALNPDTQPTAEQWKSLAEATENPVSRESMKQTEIFAHLFFPNAIQECQKKNDYYNIFYFAGLSDCMYSRLGYDWNHVMRRTLELYDEYYLENVNIAEKYGEYVDSRGEPNLKKMGWTRASRSETLAILLALRTFPNKDMYERVLLRQDSEFNLYRLGIAMQLYRLEHDGKLPPAFSVDAEGKPLHSWRVLILPYVGDEKCKELYAKIRLDEPWDSEYNRQFHAEMPEIFRNPNWEATRPASQNQQESSLSAVSPDATTRDASSPSMTNYTVILGENQLFDGTGTGCDYVQMMRDEPTREVGKMALITERQSSVPWMRPDAEWTCAEIEKMPKNEGDSVYIADLINGVSCSGALFSESPHCDEFRDWIFGKSADRKNKVEEEE